MRYYHINQPAIKFQFDLVDAQIPDEDVDGLYDVFAETQTLTLDWVDNLSPKSINAFENAYAQVKAAGLNFINSIK